MSHLLWKHYWENDVDKFRRLLAPASYGSQALSKSPAIGGVGGFSGGSLGGLGTSPRSTGKLRRAFGHPQTPGRSKDAGSGLGRAEINSRDHAGLTILLRAASSNDPIAREFVQALIEHPAIDLYVQDMESGWNALHRSLYAGSISIARTLLEKERVDLMSHNVSSLNKVGLLIKTKDHEGNSPFDVYNSTIAIRSLEDAKEAIDSNDDSESGESVDEEGQHLPKFSHQHHDSIDGDELFIFGSNKNLSLGVGDEDDRQYPERIHLKRPDELLHRLYQSYLAHHDIESSVSLPNVDDIPTLIRDQHIIIQDVIMSKLHTAIITTDPVSNLYVCGVGRGGRLGLGDENTQFKFVPVQGPLTDKKIRQVALGQNHTMAIAGNGELWTWGLNSNSQLGYTLPPPLRPDEEPMSLSPRQVFGTLKKEIILGVAASANHSVAHTRTSLFCWGRNVGQLALTDADSRSLDIQSAPRKVAASLLVAPIKMVSAIDKATICLLENHTVWVFSNYGYNPIKFPVSDVFTNHNFTSAPFSNRYRKNITYVTSGGDTIAAATARGDLFTLHVKDEVSSSTASTTNPAKIKGTSTQPQCIWDSRKDGVTSVGVGEHGSVIICTKSGAVWKRVKRIKGKTVGVASSADFKRNDFKFQRVPYITNCAAVRSSIFGAFAAIRKDSKVMFQERGIGEPKLWEDIGLLLCLQNFQSPALSPKAKESRKVWDAAIVREKPGSIPHEILKSVDIETDLQHWLEFSVSQYRDLDMQICTSLSPDLKIPVHGWAFSGRSPVLREALVVFRSEGSFVGDAFTITSVSDKVLLTLFEIDIFTMLNVIVYTYQDKVVPVWKYTRELPPEAYRFRQVRSELMKVATVLAMPKLEAASRLQTAVEPSLNVDLKASIAEDGFFEDGDVIIDLDGEEVLAHSQLICQRCPFFQGMFNGRSQGQWLATRRNGLAAAERIRVDLKHIHPDIFQYVMEYIYADAGDEIFDNIAAASIDEFSETILDVMSAANELMLDRLSQICQYVIGKFVTTRNVSVLLNEISPCSVSDFKDAGLEYVCLQLECMLENHLLDDLDEDLLQELDMVVRENQLARLPISKSGRAESLLLDTYPELITDIDDERQVRLKEMAYRYAQKDEEKKMSSSFKTRGASLDDLTPGMQSPDHSQQKPKAGRNEPFSPSLRPRQSQSDLIFDMEDEDVAKLASPRSPPSPAKGTTAIDARDMPQLPRSWREPKGKGIADIQPSPDTGFGLSASGSPQVETPRGSNAGLPTRGGKPWAAPSPSTTSKFDLKDIMSEASSKSALAAKIEEQASKEANARKSQAKVSQKERKRQLQMQAAAQAAAHVATQEKEANHIPWETVPAGGRPTPWKAATPLPKKPLKEAMAPESKVPRAKALVVSETTSKSTPQRTASPDTRFPGQGRTTSSLAVPGSSRSETQKPKPIVPHSKSYMAPTAKAEAILGLSMADIIGQQQREQELVKEAVAKRSLEEIQQEQAFQEWWDQESRRAQEEEARRQAKSKSKEGKEKSNNKRGDRRGRGGKPRNGSEATAEEAGTKASASAAPRGQGRAHSSRGKGVKGRGDKA